MDWYTWWSWAVAWEEGRLNLVTANWGLHEVITAVLNLIVLGLSLEIVEWLWELFGASTTTSVKVIVNPAKLSYRRTASLAIANQICILTSTAFTTSSGIRNDAGTGPNRNQADPSAGVQVIFDTWGHALKIGYLVAALKLFEIPRRSKSWQNLV